MAKTDSKQLLADVKLLDAVSSVAQVNRQDHIASVQAIQRLTAYFEALNKPSAEEK